MMRRPVPCILRITLDAGLRGGLRLPDVSRRSSSRQVIAERASERVKEVGLRPWCIYLSPDQGSREGSPRRRS